jgi:hypothetical protein
VRGLLGPRLGASDEISDLVFFLRLSMYEKVGISMIYFELQPFKYMGGHLLYALRALKRRKTCKKNRPLIHKTRGIFFKKSGDFWP